MLLQSTDFCTRFRISSPLPPNNVSTVLQTSLVYPPSTFIMMLCWVTSLPWNCLLSSHRSGPYFWVFSKSFNRRFSKNGLLISITITFFSFLSILYLRRFCLLLHRCFLIQMSVP